LRTASTTKGVSAEKKAEIKKAAEDAQKLYLALKTEVKKDDDKKQAQIDLQKEKEQAEFDKRNEVKLTSKERLEIVKSVQQVGAVDKNASAEEKAKALEKAKSLALDEKDKMKTALKAMDAALKAADGKKTNKAYIEAKDAYYRQKAVYETVNGLVSKSGGATKEADAKIDAIKFKRELTQEEIEAIKATITNY
jgi:hypothetical protein